MRISDWSSDVCSSDLAQTDLKQPSLGFTEAIFHVLVPEVQLAAAGLTIGVIGGQIDALRHLHGCTGAELPCEANRAVILAQRSEDHTSELQSLMRTPYAVFCLKKKTKKEHYDDNTS